MSLDPGPLEKAMAALLHADNAFGWFSNDTLVVISSYCFLLRMFLPRPLVLSLPGISLNPSTPASFQLKYNCKCSEDNNTLIAFSVVHGRSCMGFWFFGCHYPQCHYPHMGVAFWLWNPVICEASPLQRQITNCTLQGVDTLVLSQFPPQINEADSILLKSPFSLESNAR